MSFQQRLFHKLPPHASASRSRGQSFLELAILLPVLLIMLLGLVEVTVFMSRYLDLLDLTRESARFASVRDPFAPFTAYPNCSDPTSYDFYYSSACIFAPPEGSETCATDTAFCGGLNPYILMDSATDDIIITVFTITKSGQVTAVHPSSPPWAWSDHDWNTGSNANWKRDCEGEVVRSAPYYTTSRVQSMLASSQSLPARGYVAVEAYYCHHMILGLPFISDFIKNPIQTHAYTIMSLPAAQPTPTPSN
jgi:hypothetical protein